MKKVNEIKGGLTDNWTVQDVANKHEVSVDAIKKELKDGTFIEYEHTNDKKLAKEIALDHLYEMPDYYTRLKNMEDEFEKDKEKESKINENITDFAKRMRELSGLYDGDKNKSIKTIQEGISEFDKGGVFLAKDMTTLIRDKKTTGDLDINGNIIPARFTAQINEYEENEDDFETHKFEQKTIEEGEGDEELYSLNENIIIVLDFLNENDDDGDDDYVDPIKKANDNYEIEKMEKKYTSDAWVKAQRDAEGLSDDNDDDF